MSDVEHAISYDAASRDPPTRQQVDWQIGDVGVTLVRERHSAVPLDRLLVNSDSSVLVDNADWLKPNFVNDDDTLRLSFHSLILESNGKVVVVDTCTGERVIAGQPQLSNLQSGFLERFTATGLALSDVDVVVCTHLHLDHVGFNTTYVDDCWVPTFPNATYLFPRLEYEHWDGSDDPSVSSFEDAVRPVLEAGVAQLVESDHRVTDEVRLQPTPGHSPGHVCVRIASRGDEAVITGDVVHSPIQFAAPDWAMFADSDAALASATRRQFRDQFANTGTRIFGTHFGGPSSGFLEHTAGRYRFLPVVATEPAACNRRLPEPVGDATKERRR